MGEQNLKVFAGVYHQEDGNSFVISISNGSLYLKIGKEEEKKLSPSGPNTFDIQDLGAKIQFHATNEIPHSLELILPDRRTIAKREFVEIPDGPSAKGFAKEMLFGVGLLIVLAGVLIGGNSVWTGLCEKGSKGFCYLATASNVFKGNTKSVGNVTQKAQENQYKDNMEGLKDGCENDKDPEACYTYAKAQKDLGKEEEFISILNFNCPEKKHFASCKALAQHYKFIGKADLGIQVLDNACNNANMGEACFYLAELLKKSDDKLNQSVYLTKGCTLNHALSCNELGYHFQLTETEKAIKFFKVACDLKHKPSCSQIEEINLYKQELQSCKNDSASGCRGVAQFLNRFGNQNKAISFYKMACNLKDKTACIWLKKRKIQ